MSRWRKIAETMHPDDILAALDERDSLRTECEALQAESEALRTENEHIRAEIARLKRLVQKATKEAYGSG